MNKHLSTKLLYLIEIAAKMSPHIRSDDVKLTQKQANVLGYIKTHIDYKGYAPNTVELAKYLKVYPNAALGHLQALRKKGAITWSEGKQRSVRPVDGFKVIIKGEK